MESEERIYEARGAAHVHQERESSWIVEFSLPGLGQMRKRYPSARAAKLAANLAASVLDLIRGGHIATPAGASKTEIRDFVLNGGKPAAAPPPAATSPPRASEPVVPPRRTIAGFIDGALACAPPGKEASTRSTENVHLRHFRRFLEARGLLETPVAGITSGTLKDYRDARHKTVGPVTINKEVDTLNGLLLQAVQDGLIAKNPVAELTRLKIPSAPEFQTLDEIERQLREGVYSKEDERRLRRARILYPREVDDLLQLATGLDIEVPLTVAAFTGGRRSEVARLTWADIHMQTHEVVLKSKKQSKTIKTTPRRVSMHPRLKVALEVWRAKTGGEGYLFRGHRRGSHISPKTLHDWIKTLVEGTPFVGIGWHTLRHSLASNMARAGVDGRVIDAIMGHTGEQMAARYRHLFPQQRQNAVEAAWDDQQREAS